MSTPKPIPETPVGVQFSKDEDFLSRYANNVHLEITGWDLKLVFGQTDLQIGPQAVVQHTALTISWPYAKILSYLLQAHIAAKEVEDGKIMVPKGIIAVPSDELPKELVGKLKHPKEGIELMQRLYKEFIAANPEATSRNK